MNGDFDSFRVLAITSFSIIMFAQFAFFTYYASRKKTLISKHFALIFFLAGLGLLLNIAYLFMPSLLLLHLFYRLSLWCYFFGITMNMIFVLNMYRSIKLEKIGDKINSLDVLLLIIFSIVIWVGLLLPDSIKIQLPEKIPIYSIFLYLLLLVIFGIMLTTSIFIGIKSYYALEQADLRKKWILYIIGSILVQFILVGSTTINYLNITELRSIWYVIMFPIAITGNVLVYYGGIKQL